MNPTKPVATDAFHVDPWIHVLGGLVSRYRQAWIRLGNLETRLLNDDLEDFSITAPLYIAGLARSGSTLLLEILNRHPQVATHRYQDYPLLFTPYAWHRFLERVPRRREEPAERAHGDGIQVTPKSPEAFEEVLWMAFFSALHDPRQSSVLDESVDNPEFETFYRDHVRKLLMARQGSRYLSKGNYNVSRLKYLQKMFPDARFIIPVRDPVWHIASLMKQHRLFCAGQQAHGRALTHLQRVGHFEFGLDRRPINTGDQAAIENILKCWENGDEVEGWARYWSHVHHYLADCLENSAHLRQASLVIRFEELCRNPEQTVRELLGHCNLFVPEGMPEQEAQGIRFPDYYQPDFSLSELETIHHFTQDAATRLGLGKH